MVQKTILPKMLSLLARTEKVFRDLQTDNQKLFAVTMVLDTLEKETSPRDLNLALTAWKEKQSK